MVCQVPQGQLGLTAVLGPEELREARDRSDLLAFQEPLDRWVQMVTQDRRVNLVSSAPLGRKGVREVLEQLASLETTEL